MTPKKKQSTKTPTKPFVGKCFNCETDVTDDDFCHGCRAYLCQPCNVGGLNVMGFGHAREVHLKHYDDEGNELDESEIDEL